LVGEGDTPPHSSPPWRLRRLDFRAFGSSILGPPSGSLVPPATLELATVQHLATAGLSNLIVSRGWIILQTVTGGRMSKSRGLLYYNSQLSKYCVGCEIPPSPERQRLSYDCSLELKAYRLYQNM